MPARPQTRIASLAFRLVCPPGCTPTGMSSNLRIDRPVLRGLGSPEPSSRQRGIALGSPCDVSPHQPKLPREDFGQNSGCRPSEVGLAKRRLGRRSGGNSKVARRSFPPSWFRCAAPSPGQLPAKVLRSPAPHEAVHCSHKDALDTPLITPNPDHSFLTRHRGLPTPQGCEDSAFSGAGILAVSTSYPCVFSGSRFHQDRPGRHGPRVLPRGVPAVGGHP
jgi:hypothetical protein